MKNTVLVLGDVMLDQRLEGRMTRVSPEAPTPVVLQENVVLLPGGAANVAANLAALQTPTLLLGVVGTDNAGEQLGSLLQHRYGVASQLLAYPQVRTLVKTRVTCGGQQVLRIDQEDLPIGTWNGFHVDAAVQSLQAVLVPDFPLAAVVVSDYGKGTMHAGLVSYLLAQTAARNIPVFVDCKPATVANYRGAYLLKPNLHEALEMGRACVHPALSSSGTEEDKASVLAAYLRDSYGVQCVVITRGANGATWYDGQETVTSSVLSQEVFDVTGAGDTFLAALVAATVRGHPLASAVVQANTAASEAVAHHGTYIVDRQQLDRAIRRRLGPAGKIVDLGQVTAQVQQVKQRGQRVVLTNGCFRILHHGHLNLLRWARAQGDFLVVAVNSDSSIRQLKGDKQIAANRLELLAELSYVDAITVFDEPNVAPVVRAIDPDVLVKGDEYRQQRVPGADHVAANGGRVLFAPRLLDISSSQFDTPLLDPNRLTS